MRGYFCAFRTRKERELASGPYRFLQTSERLGAGATGAAADPERGDLGQAQLRSWVPPVKVSEEQGPAF